MSQNKKWDYDLDNIPVERCHWLAIEQWYGPEFSQFVADGFYDPVNGKYYFSDGNEVTGNVIAYMEKDPSPKFPEYIND